MDKSHVHFFETVRSANKESGFHVILLPICDIDKLLFL